MFNLSSCIIYQSNGTTWITYGGAGATPTIQAVLTAGDTATIDMFNQNCVHRFYPAPYNVNNATYISPEAVGCYGTNNCAITFYQASGNEIKTVFSSSAAFNQGFRFNFDNFLYEFGDFVNNNNGTKIVIDDNNHTNTLTQDVLQLNGTITTATAGSNSGQHLQVTINATPYVIELRNP